MKSPTFQRAKRILLLLLVMQATSAMTFRCWFFCTDQTGIQNDYLADRSDCRAYADSRVGPETAPAGVTPDKKARAAHTQKLVTVFSECMETKGWSIPVPESKSAAPPPPPVVRVAAPPPPPPPPPQSDYTKQYNECTYARHAADISSVANARAKECDIRCTKDLRSWKYGDRRPPSCPDVPFGSEKSKK